MAVNQTYSGFIYGFLKSKSCSDFLSENVVKAHAEYKRVRFGPTRGRIYNLLPIDKEEIQDLHYSINMWSDTELQAWKISYIAACNAVSVAAAIFATFGLSALQLPHIDDIHWIVRALFSISMLSGVMSVVSATRQQQLIGSINDPTAIRVYLSSGPPKERNRTNGIDPYPHPYCTFPLNSSASASFFLDFPRKQLGKSVLVFVMGFALYLILSWAKNISDSGIEYRNIFIIFIVFALYNGVTYATYSIAGLTDMVKAVLDLDVYQLKTPLLKSEKVQKLEQELKALCPDRGLNDEIRDLAREVAELRCTLAPQSYSTRNLSSDTTSVDSTTK